MTLKNFSKIFKVRTKKKSNIEKKIVRKQFSSGKNK